jgi:hypothetical protein
MEVIHNGVKDKLINLATFFANTHMRHTLIYKSVVVINRKRKLLRSTIMKKLLNLFVLQNLKL